jgi:hypothetical protein
MLAIDSSTDDGGLELGPVMAASNGVGMGGNWAAAASMSGYGYQMIWLGLIS